MRRKDTIIKTFGLVLLAVVTACFLVYNAPAYQTDPQTAWYKLYYDKAHEKQAKAIIQELGGRAPEYNPEAQYVIVSITPQEAQAYSKMGFRLEAFSDYDLLHAWNPYSRGDRTIPGYPCYRQVAELFQSGQQIATNYPNLATWKDVGDSYLKSIGQGGYDIWVLVLTNKSVTLPKPALLITGGIHAREYVTAETAMRFAEYLVQNYGTNADVTWLLDYNEIHIMPEINPDGRTMADGTTSSILWRKNKHMHDNNPCSNTSSSHIGADLNRNFPFMWNTAGTMPGVCDETYAGKSAGSEPETQAVRNYYLALFNDYNTSPTSPASLNAMGIYIDLHSYSQLVLWSWGHTTTLAPNSTGLQTLGRKFAFFNNHTPQQAVGLYPTSGATEDDCYAERGIPGYCFEMGTAFFQDCSSFQSTIYPTNLQALLYAAKACRAPYKIPTGPDALNVAQNNNVLTASINDTRYNNSNGTETTHNITAAEYYIDHPDFDGGTPIAMAASDGAFNSKTENVTANINCSGFGDGIQHTIFVRGKDTSNNWGPYTAIFLSPVPDFDYNALGSANVKFIDKSKPINGINAWNWSFGDGTNSTTQNPSHVYQKPYMRSYNVTLTVTDNNHNTCSITKQVQFRP
jgi:murein tripeptide amidase MpaA